MESNPYDFSDCPNTETYPFCRWFSQFVPIMCPAQNLNFRSKTDSGKKFAEHGRHFYCTTKQNAKNFKLCP